MAKDKVVPKDNTELTVNAVAVEEISTPVSYDENTVEPGNRSRCRTLVKKIQVNLSRMVSQAVDIGEHLKELQTLMPNETFQAVLSEDFKISTSTAWRWMRAYEYVSVNYSEHDRLHLIPRFNISAIEFLSSPSNADAFTPEQIKELAANTDANKLVSRKSLEAIIAELEETNNKQQTMINDLERESANDKQLALSLKSQVTELELVAERTQQALMNRTQEISQLMQEVQDKGVLLAQMKKELAEKPKEVAMLPAEYVDMKDAIQKLESELADLGTRKSKLEDTVKSLQTEARVAQGALHDHKSLQAALQAFIHDMQMLVTKHDLTVIGDAFKITNDKTKETVLNLISSVKGLELVAN